MHAKYQLMMTDARREQDLPLSCYHTLKEADAEVKRLANTQHAVDLRHRTNWTATRLDRHAWMEQYTYLEKYLHQYIYWIQRVSTGQPVLSC